MAQDRYFSPEMSMSPSSSPSSSSDDETGEFQLAGYALYPWKDGSSVWLPLLSMKFFGQDFLAPFITVDWESVYKQKMGPTRDRCASFTFR
ncbi:unnamed protein product [Darwinula stevensoni]|uniref:Uncharacterized protein n=1 Tax=Darwinula stevensoni TaxID=69355 RepID=A0A7R8X5M5_9CRUS|nr:unnamed protein product [Darwinula stevensoni]CAG0878708.1 unnamed protein product [Darwinula stevensoni]